MAYLVFELRFSDTQTDAHTRARERGRHRRALLQRRTAIKILVFHKLLHVKGALAAEMTVLDGQRASAHDL